MSVLASLRFLAAFIHTLQHWTEDSNGVLWVVCNPMPLPKLRDASTSSNGDTSLRNLRKHQRLSLHPKDPVASEEQDSSLTKPHVPHRGLLAVFLNHQIFSALCPSIFFLDSLHQPFPSLFSFVHPLHLCQFEKLPED